MPTRLEQLQKFYEDDPQDPFNIYGLALEYQKTDPVKAAHFFNILLEHHPDYIPAYYHAAKLFEQMDNKARAIKTFEFGITVARKANDLKAMRELQSAYNELMFE
jgi:hypothetical protein